MKEDKIVAEGYGLGQGCDHVTLCVEGAGRCPVFPMYDDQASALVSIHYDTNTSIAVVLMVDTDHGASVTNSAGELLSFIQKNLLDPRGIEWGSVKWAYRDSMGRWDEIVPLSGWRSHTVGVGFKPLGRHAIDDALALIVARGMPLIEEDVASLKAWAEKAMKG